MSFFIAAELHQRLNVTVFLFAVQFRDGLESRISDYEIIGNQVILQIETVSINSHLL